MLLDLNLERKAKKAERIGIGVAKRLALVQADIWAKRGATGDIYELEPLLAVDETCTRSASGKLVDESAQQSHLLVRHKKKRFGMQSLQHVPCRQTIQFLEPNPLCPARPCAADVISQFRNIRQQNAYTDDSACEHLMWRAAKEPRI